MNKRNIILIGMPGAGKSSVGVILAKVLGYEFIDTDLVIQHREKRLLREIIADEGNEGFLAIENEVNATLEADKSVIAPGGSAIYGKEAMEHFKEIGTIVYLKLSYEDLAKRLGNLKGRGVVLKEGQTRRISTMREVNYMSSMPKLRLTRAEGISRARSWRSASRSACKTELVEYSGKF